MFAQSQVTCNKCGGRGRIIMWECPACGGHKVLDHSAQFTLNVPRGVPEGHEVVYEGEGDESPDWEPGDVVLHIRSRPEKGGWRCKESSLYWKETIGVDEVRAVIIDFIYFYIMQTIKGEGMLLFTEHIACYHQTHQVIKTG